MTYLKLKKNFWLEKPLNQLSQHEWEALCDGCAKCCTLKIEDEDDGVVYDTNVVCRYLEQDSCQCQCYQQRSIEVPECISLNKDNLEQSYFMPSTCSYRLLYENKPLPKWHHLISQDKSLVHQGYSVKGKVICETQADDLFYHLTGKLLDS